MAQIARRCWPRNWSRPWRWLLCLDAPRRTARRVAHVRVATSTPLVREVQVRLSVVRFRRAGGALRNSARTATQWCRNGGVTDHSEKRPVFLEVNPRFWNSLACRSTRESISRPACAHGRYGDVEPQSEYRIGRRADGWSLDFGHFIQVLKGKPKGFPATFRRACLPWGIPKTGARKRITTSSPFRDPFARSCDWLHYFWTIDNMAWYSRASPDN